MIKNGYLLIFSVGSHLFESNIDSNNNIRISSYSFPLIYFLQFGHPLLFNKG